MEIRETLTSFRNRVFDAAGLWPEEIPGHSGSYPEANGYRGPILVRRGDVALVAIYIKVDGQWTLGACALEGSAAGLKELGAKRAKGVAISARVQEQWGE